MNTNRHFHLILGLGLVALSSSCSRQARITGTVSDFAGKPIANAAVSVEGTQFQTTTDAQGAFSVEFVPGKFTVRANAQGYLPTQVPLEVTQATIFPAAPIKLPKMPIETELTAYLTGEVPKQTIRHQNYDTSWTTYSLGEFTQLQSLSVSDLQQVGDRDVVATVAVRYRALMDLLSDNVIGAWQPVSGLDHAYQKNAVWNHRFKVRFHFQEPGTWTWVDSMPL